MRLYATGHRTLVNALDDFNFLARDTHRPLLTTTVGGEEETPTVTTALMQMLVDAG